MRGGGGFKKPYEITNVQKFMFTFHMLLRKPQISSNSLQRISVSLTWVVSPYQELVKRENSSRLWYIYIQHIHWNTSPHPFRHQNIHFSSSSDPFCLITEEKPIPTSEFCTHQKKVVIWPKAGPRGLRQRQVSTSCHCEGQGKRWKKQG